MLLGLLLAVGALAGVSAGLFGIGGGAVMVPALFFVFDYMGFEAAVHVAVATSAAVIILNGARAVRGHALRGSVDAGLLKGWGPWIALGSLLGAWWLAPRLSGEVMGMVFVGMAGLVALQFIFGRPEAQLVEAPPGFPVSAVGGSVVGGLSAIMGIGGGSLTVPLMSLAGVPIHRAIGTASGFGLAIAVPATLGYMVSGLGVVGRPPGSVGYVNGPGFAVVALVSVMCVPLGVRLAHGLDGVVLKRVFGAALLLVAANMARRLLIG